MDEIVRFDATRFELIITPSAQAPELPVARIVAFEPRPIVPPVIVYRVEFHDAIGANVIPPAVTLPLTVTVPAVPLAPKTAMLDDVLGQARFVVPSHQFVPEAEVLQVPLPSCGPVVEKEESHVTWA